MKLKYVQKFKEEWQKFPEFKGWLQKSFKGTNSHFANVSKLIRKSEKDAIVKLSLRNIREEKS